MSETRQYFWVRHKARPEVWMPAELVTPVPPTLGVPQPYWLLVGSLLPVDSFEEIGPPLEPPARGPDATPLSIMASAEQRLRAIQAELADCAVAAPARSYTENAARVASEAVASAVRILARNPDKQAQELPATGDSAGKCSYDFRVAEDAPYPRTVVYRVDPYLEMGYFSADAEGQKRAEEAAKYLNRMEQEEGNQS